MESEKLFRITDRHGDYVYTVDETTALKGYAVGQIVEMTFVEYVKVRFALTADS